MALSHLFTQFVPLSAFVLSASLLAHGIHRMSYSHVDLMY